jgi:hypothetical protein
MNRLMLGFPPWKSHRTQEGQFTIAPLKRNVVGLA